MECANRFAILADTAEADESLQGKINFLHCTDVDPDASKGESLLKNTPIATSPQVSNHSVDKYDLELRFKPKHRNAVNLAKNNATFKRWNDQTTTKYGFILLGDFLCPEKDARNPCTADLCDTHKRVNECTNLSSFPIKGGQVGLIPSGLLGQPIKISH